MRNSIAVVVVVGLLCVCGCVHSDRQTMSALDGSWQLMKPYVLSGIEADTTLDPDSRAIRLRQVEEFTLLIQEALVNAN